MKRLICILVFAGMFFRLSAHLPLHSAGGCIFNRQTITYTENKKQWNQKILFKAELPQGALFLEKNTLTYLLHHPDNEKFYHQHALSDTSFLLKRGEVLKHHAYKMHFINANENVSLLSENANEDYENYFIGNNPDNWATGVKSYQTVVYKNLYPNIDMKLYSHENQIKYDLILHEGALPEQIWFEYEGLDKLEIKKGNLILHTSVGEQMEGKPEAYQIINKKKKKIGVKYVLVENRLTFELDNYNKQYPVIIDPVVYFATYSGATADNWGYTAAYDNEGNVYMGGIVFKNLDPNINYPATTGAYQTIFGGGGCDIAIMKLNPECSKRLYATYLGGNQAEMPHSMVVNDLNELIVYGTTGSDNFPTTTNAYQKDFKKGTGVDYLNSSQISFPEGSDIFVSKFSRDGANLLASTYIGGSGNDGLNYKKFFNRHIDYYGNDSLYASYGDGARGELITDNQGNIYVGSCTFSSDFPVTLNSFQPHPGGGQDGVVFKLDAGLSNLIWGSYLGGSGDDAVYSVFTDSEYNIVATGGTNSINFPVSTDACQKQYGGGSADAFVTKISSVGNIILASTYLGTTAYDQAFFVRLDKEDNVYLLGQTKGGGTSLVYNSQYFVENGSQFVSQFNPNLTNLQWSTMFGSGRTVLSPDLSLSAFGVDRCKRTYIAGWGRFFLTDAGTPKDIDFGTKGLPTTVDAKQRVTDGQDFYILCLSPEASNISYASFVGEMNNGGNLAGIDHVDGGTSRFSKFGTLYQSVCASCGSIGGEFPLSDSAYSKVKNSSNCNNAVFSMAIHDDFAVADFAVNPDNGCSPLTVSIQNTSRGDDFFWDFGNGRTSNSRNPGNIYYPRAGVYTITLIADMNNAFCGPDTLKKTVIVLGRNYSLPNVKTCPNIPVQIGIPPMDSLKYQWFPFAGLTDSSAANPFATVSQNTLYKVVVSNGICNDTISQWVIIDTLTVDAGNNINTCNSPQIFTAHSNKEKDVFYQWSSNNLFTDTLNASPTDSMAVIYVEKAQFYYVKAETSQGCVATDSVKIDFKSIFDVYTMETIKCYGDCSAKIRISPSQYITFPARYYWDGDSVLFNTAIDIDSLCAEKDTLLVVDAAGCLQERILEIKQPEEIITTPSIVHVSCKDVCNGSISADVKGGTFPYTYKWNTGDTTPYIENLCIGNYSLTITDANGCKTTNNFEIGIEGTIFFKTMDFSNTCRPYCTGGVWVEISATKYPITGVKWNTGDTTKVVNGLCAGTYTVTITDSLGCKAFGSVTIDNRYIFDNMKVWADTTTILETETAQLYATEIDHIKYLWSPSVGLSNPSAPTTQAHPNKTTTYYLQASDIRGCVYIDSITINVINIECGEPTFFIPNAFTPNGDGKNDFFCIESDWVVSYSLLIYNRWGEKVFETNDPEKCWDGTYKGKECESGVYVYSLDVQCKATKNFQKKGDVTLIR